MKIVVLGGGDSPEREVSLRSAKAVSDALKSSGFKVVDLDPINPTIFDKITKGSLIFPILHGKNGEDGVIQAELESRNLPYLGSISTVSKVCFDKNAARMAFQQAGLPTAQGDLVDEEEYYQHPLTKLPHVLKVNKGGSSIGTYLVSDPKNIDTDKVKAVFELDKEAVIEELVTGVEITVPILDGRALPVIEIKPPKNEEFDYLNKYNGKTNEICPAVSIDEATQIQAQNFAEKAHKALGCRHLSRVDLIVRTDSSMVILEINTMPGMTSQSLYPLGAKAAGMTFPQLMSGLVKMVIRDYGL